MDECTKRERRTDWQIELAVLVLGGSAVVAETLMGRWLGDVRVVGAMFTVPGLPSVVLCGLLLGIFCVVCRRGRG